MAEEMTRDRLLDILRVSKAADAFPRGPISISEFEMRHLRFNVPDDEILEEIKLAHAIHGMTSPWEELTLRFVWATEFGMVTLVNRDAWKPLAESCKNATMLTSEFL